MPYIKSLAVVCSKCQTFVPAPQIPKDQLDTMRRQSERAKLDLQCPKCGHYEGHDAGSLFDHSFFVE